MHNCTCASREKAPFISGLPPDKALFPGLFVSLRIRRHFAGLSQAMPLSLQPVLGGALLNGAARALTLPRYDSVENDSPGKEIMRTYSTTAITGAVLTTLLFALSAVARDHNVLNGTWTLAPAQSDFAGQPVVQTGTVTIHDRQGIIVISRSFVYEGANETFFYSDSAGSEHNSTIHTGKDLKSKTKWDHDVLKVTTTQSGAITVESYSLAADGAMRVSVVRPQRQPITLVFHK